MNTQIMTHALNAFPGGIGPGVSEKLGEMSKVYLQNIRRMGGIDAVINFPTDKFFDQEILSRKKHTKHLTKFTKIKKVSHRLMADIRDVASALNKATEKDKSFTIDFKDLLWGVKGFEFNTPYAEMVLNFHNGFNPESGLKPGAIQVILRKYGLIDGAFTIGVLSYCPKDLVWRRKVIAEFKKNLKLRTFLISDVEEGVNPLPRIDIAFNYIKIAIQSIHYINNSLSATNQESGQVEPQYTALTSRNSRRVKAVKKEPENIFKFLILTEGESKPEIRTASVKTGMKVRPHWRRGHFRFIKSKQERIWVNHCRVNKGMEKKLGSVEKCYLYKEKNLLNQTRQAGFLIPEKKETL